MEIKQHIKGVLLAIVSATAILFTISFFVGSQILVNHDIIINSDKDKVFNYVKQPDNFLNWIEGSDGINAKPTANGKGIQYIGFNEKMHEFNFLVSETASGIEINYTKESELVAVFKVQVKEKAEGCVVFYEKIWNISDNPLTKLFSLSMDEDIEEGMKKELMSLKKLIEKGE
jgi:hypothetical protein